MKSDIRLFQERWHVEGIYNFDENAGIKDVNVFDGSSAQFSSGAPRHVRTEEYQQHRHHQGRLSVFGSHMRLQGRQWSWS